MAPPLPRADLDSILAVTEALWAELRGGRLLMTGGTGFFGSWLTESFLHCNCMLGLGASLTVLTRDPAAFLRRLPHLAGARGPSLLQGDVRTFPQPPGRFTHVVHAATEASARLLAEDPNHMHETIVAGTGRVLQVARAAGTRKLLFVSSGAVYGRQPEALESLVEEQVCKPVTAYGQGKVLAEELCRQAAGPELEIKLARPFAFIGPHLPLDTHFAAGNFLADALAGRSIHCASDGTAVRSYLYAADLAAQLWTLLFRAPALRPYNIGSEQPVSIAELARTIAQQTPGASVTIVGAPTPGKAPDRYIPCTRRTAEELGLRPTVSLADAIRCTLAWHRLE